MAAELHIKRVYDKPDEDDGLRVLVDRLWPRGLSKTAARIDLWARELAPSDDLRRWFGHEPSKWEGFRERYLQELTQADKADHLAALRQTMRSHRKVTLLYAAHDQAHNNAVVLQQLLQQR
jgi:uncharacterized protein YeaO (DUF488 family)